MVTQTFATALPRRTSLRLGGIHPSPLYALGWLLRFPSTEILHQGTTGTLMEEGFFVRSDLEAPRIQDLRFCGGWQYSTDSPQRGRLFTTGRLTR